MAYQSMGDAHHQSAVHPALARPQDRADARGPEAGLAREALLQIVRRRGMAFASAREERLELSAIDRIDLVLEESLGAREKPPVHGGEATFAPELRQHAPVLDSRPVSRGSGSPGAAELPRRLSILDSAAIVVGSVIGSAIFIVPNSVAENLPSIPLFLLVWVFTGVLSFFGALAYAELGAMIPATGGQYVYIREAFGPLPAFLCGWAFFLVILSGSIATLAVAFSIYLSYFVPLGAVGAKLVSAALILALTLVNYRGVRQGAAVQLTFTLLKVAGLTILVGSAFLASRHPGVAATPQPGASFPFREFGVAMIACLWAYEGWYCLSSVAGEVKNPQRNVPLALGLGVVIIVTVYLSANLAYLRILPIDEIARSPRVAATVAERTIGSLGASFVSLTILLSIAGAVNGTILTAARVYFAQARDALFFARAGEVHPRYETPGVSLVYHGVWAAILALSGSYELLYSYVIFAAWIFYGMTVTGVLILRRRRPEAPRPYRMWGYPVTPLLFAFVSFWFVLNTLATTPGPSLAGIAIIASGIPVYFYFRSKARVAAA
jgi:APA family basic amino acid/polyamine antiporter